MPHARAEKTCVERRWRPSQGRCDSVDNLPGFPLVWFKDAAVADCPRVQTYITELSTEHIVLVCTSRYVVLVERYSTRIWPYSEEHMLVEIQRPATLRKKRGDAPLTGHVSSSESARARLPHIVFSFSRLSLCCRLVASSRVLFSHRPCATMESVNFDDFGNRCRCESARHLLVSTP